MKDRDSVDILSASPEAEIKVQCSQCVRSFTLTVPLEGLYAWKNGALIQNAMPNLTADERELLISQTCGECFWVMIGDAYEMPE